MNYYDNDYYRKNRDKIFYPCLVFSKDNWDDFGFKTTFRVYYYVDSSDYEHLGDVKILDLNTNNTVLEGSFEELDKNQCSLGQSLEYYDNLKNSLPDTFESVLNDLNDVAIFEKNAKNFESISGFSESLLRFGSASLAYQDATLWIYENRRHESEELNFTYTTKLDGADGPHVATFDFVKTDDFPFRINVIIGKNGTGKTQFLGNLVSSISGVDPERNLTPFIPLFNRVIAISYSLFDEFPKPEETTVFSYKYIGLRSDKKAIVSDEILTGKLQNAFKLILKNNREDEWYHIVNSIIPLSQMGLDDSDDITTKWISSLSYQRTKRLSSGQSILLFILTELIAHIKEQSMILFDEPETHLHPTAIAQLTNALSKILKTYSSFAIISTHSPIVIQDVPSKYITVFERLDNLPIIKKLPIESFGENLSVLTNTVFETNDVQELFKKHFKTLKRNSHSEKEINELFDNKLSLNAQLFLAAIFDTENEKS